MHFQTTLQDQSFPFEWPHSSLWPLVLYMQLENVNMEPYFAKKQPHYVSKAPAQPKEPKKSSFWDMIDVFEKTRRMEERRSPYLPWRLTCIVECAHFTRACTLSESRLRGWFSTATTGFHDRGRLINLDPLLHGLQLVSSYQREMLRLIDVPST